MLQIEMSQKQVPLKQTIAISSPHTQTHTKQQGAHLITVRRRNSARHTASSVGLPMLILGEQSGHSWTLISRNKQARTRFIYKFTLCVVRVWYTLAFL